MIKSKLAEIGQPIEKELAYFSELFKDSLKSKVSLVDLVTKYILKQKGKKVRPLLVLLSAKVAGGINDRSYRGAILVELLHTATLVHDDVVDNADIRRGFPSINAIWKNKIAVLMGDYLLSRGLLVSVEGKDFDFLNITTNAVRRMSEGELLQISKTRKLDIDEDTYFRIISDKTASLLSTCCEIGAASATSNSDYHYALKMFGENLGLAFQIRDDILDYVGKSSIIGKPAGADLREKKITLPLIYALKNADQKKSSEVLKMLKNPEKKNNIQEIIEFTKRNNGIEYAVKTALGFSQKAKDFLNIFPDSASKIALESMVDFVNDRKN